MRFALPLLLLSLTTVLTAQRYPVRIGERWGLIDRSGAVVCDPSFALDGDLDDVCFAEGRCAARVQGAGGLVGFVDEAGAFAVEPAFADAQAYAAGLAAVQLPGRATWGYVDADGQVAIEARFDEVNAFSNGLAAVRRGAWWSWIDRAGDELPTERYDLIGDFDGMLAWALRDERWRYVDREGREVWREA